MALSAAPQEVLDPEALSRLRSLKLMAKLAVEGFLNGLHTSLAHGSGMEFHQYRDYTPGEDLKYLDWKLLARSNRLYTKCFREETNTDCQLLIDCSASMRYQGTQSAVSKLRYAVMTAACLATLASRQGDSVGLFAYADTLKAARPASRSGSGLDSVYRILTGLEASGSAQHEPILTGLARRFRRRSIVILLSDLLDAETVLPPVLQGLRARGSDVMVLQILDPDEVALPDTGATRYIDCENGQERMAPAASIRDHYNESFAEWKNGLERELAQARISFETLLTQDALGPTLHCFLKQRQGRS